MTKSTKHTCGGPSFGRLTDGCPRCDELKAGAPARRLSPGHEASLRLREINRRNEAMRPKHNCQTSGCGPVCTWGEW